MPPPISPVQSLVKKLTS